MKEGKLIELRKHQNEAIEAFEKNSYSGILEMATGSGKTYTAIEASRRYHKKNKRGFLVIFVPFQHLIKQWQISLNNMGYKNVITNTTTTKEFHYELDGAIRDYKSKITDIEIAILCYQSSTNSEFIKRLLEVDGNLMLIADECHYMGAHSYQQLFDLPFDFKLGLSATPDRWWDEKGTNELKMFFKGTVFEYGIQDSINDKALVPYEYIAHPTEMNSEEMSRYIKLSDAIIKAFRKDPKNEDEIDRLLIQRARLLNNIESKKRKFCSLMNEYASSDLKHMIVFVGPSQILEYLRLIEKYGLSTGRFDSTFSKTDREKMLKQFENGTIQVLVAIKCLDEGVDIPQAKIGILVSSTTNPREFIQRRGRLLRTHIEKSQAIIHDFVVFNEDAPKKILEKLAYREMPRVSEFSRESTNTYRARDQFYQILKTHNLENILDKTPWEVYNERKEFYVDEENA